jgi:ATP-dependent Clp protease ATP-binding subunit ClpA
MLSHFSQAAQTLVHLAEQECRNASHYYLGTEHLLLAMAISPTPDVAAYFQERNTEAWRVKQAVRALMNEPAEHPWEGVVITPRTLRVFASATTAARARGSLVEPADILNSIIEDGRGVAARALRSVASQTASTT